MEEDRLKPRISNDVKDSKYEATARGEIATRRQVAKAPPTPLG